MAQPDMGLAAKTLRTIPGYGMAALILGGTMAAGVEYTAETMMLLTIGVSWGANRFVLPLYDLFYAKLAGA